MAARRRRILLDIGGSSAEARRVVREVRDEVRKAAREKAAMSIDVQTAGATEQLRRLEARLDRLSRQEATPEVKIRMGRVSEQIDRLRLKLDRLGAKRVEVDVDVRRGTLERAAAGLGAVERGVSGISRGFTGLFGELPIVGGLLEKVLGGALSLAENLGNAIGGLVSRGISALASQFSSLGAISGPIGSAVGSVVSLGAALAGIAAVAGGVVIVLNAILGAIIALAGALVALVASAAAAAAGLGALAIAFGAVLIPVLLVGIGVFQRFQAVMKARQAGQQALAQATQRQTAAENAHRAALQRVHAEEASLKQAEDSRRQAQERLSQAVVAGHRAEAQAAIDAKNAELALADARLGVESAKLNVLDAQKALKDLLTQAGVTGAGLDRLLHQFSDVHVDPTKLQNLLGAVGGAGGQVQKVDPLALAHAVLNLQLAQQGVKDAVNQTAQAERNLGDATRKRSDFAQRGLKAYAPYRQALRAVQQADDRVAAAEKRLGDAHARLVVSQNKATAAQDKYQRALKGLSPTEQGFLGSLDRFIKKLTDFAKLVTGPVFSGLQKALGSISALLGDTGIRSGFQAIGKAIGDFFAKLGGELTSKDWRSAFAQFAAAGARMVGTGGQGFIYLLRILRQIALTALPFVEKALRGVSAWLGRIAGQPGKIHSAVRFLVGQFKTWAGLVGSIGHFIEAVFPHAARAGQLLAHWLTRVVDKWTTWINKHPVEVERFFHHAVYLTEHIFKWIAKAAHWLANNLPSSAKKAKGSFDSMAKVASGIYHTFKVLTDLLQGRFLDALREAGKIHIGSPAGDPTRNPTTDPGGGGSLGDRILHALGFASGGPVPGSGRGDTVHTMLEPGEFVLRRSVAQQLGLPILRALNGGAVPAVAAVGSAPVAAGDTHHHYHVPPVPGGQYPDARVMFEHINTLVDLKG